MREIDKHGSPLTLLFSMFDFPYSLLFEIDLLFLIVSYLVLLFESERNGRRRIRICCML